MDIRRFICGAFSTNSYLLTIGDECILIDPASKPEKMIEVLKDKKLLAILLTHGHFDHIKAVDGLYDKYKCPIYLGIEDRDLVKDKHAAESFMISNCPTVSKPLTFYKEGLNKIGPFEFEAIFTPGHTPGSVCLRFGEDLFSGDTLFRLSAGRTDLKGGSDADLKSSLRIINSINEDLIVHPGHDDETTLDFEKANNPFLANM